MSGEGKANERWRQIAARPDEEINLAEAALVIAAEEYCALDIEAYLAWFERTGATLRRRLRPDISTADAIVALNHYLFEELRFSANRVDYYDPRNSLLNDVIDRRLGIPITLSIVYMEVGRRIGLPLHGVSFPGHFLVKCVLRGGAVVLDPYARGISLGLDDLVQRIMSWRPGIEPEEDLVRSLLVTAGNREILARMLRNLKGVYVQKGALGKALSASERLIALEPRAAEEYRDRARIYVELECFRAALADFRAYLLLKPDAEDAPEVKHKAAELQQLAARLN